MGRVYLTNPYDGKNFEIHYRIHKLECNKCKLANKTANCTTGKVNFCDKHTKSKSR